jgi:MFS family permease
MCVGVMFYIVYVGALWYFDAVGKFAYPIVAGVIIGIGSGMVFITAGYIQTSYPEEQEKGLFITTQLNLQATGSVIGGIIPVIINRNSATTDGVPHAVYISFIVIMFCAALSGLLLLPPHKLRRDDGSVVAVDKARGPWEELKANLLIFTDWKLLCMVPAFLPAECFLVYSGSVNGA